MQSLSARNGWFPNPKLTAVNLRPILTGTLWMATPQILQSCLNFLPHFSRYRVTCTDLNRHAVTTAPTPSARKHYDNCDRISSVDICRYHLQQVDNTQQSRSYDGDKYKHLQKFAPLKGCSWRTNFFRTRGSLVVIVGQKGWWHILTSKMLNWLVVSAPLENMSQLGGLFPNSQYMEQRWTKMFQTTTQSKMIGLHSAQYTPGKLISQTCQAQWSVRSRGSTFHQSNVAMECYLYTKLPTKMQN